MRVHIWPPVTLDWVDLFIVQPYAEGGVDSLNRVFFPKEDPARPPLTLKERSICLVTGTFYLCCPLLNTVVWIMLKILKSGSSPPHRSLE